MKEKEFGLLEQDIIKEESPQSNVKIPGESKLPKIFSKISALLLKAKKPKVITLLILALAIFIVYLALTLIGQRQKEGESLPNVEQTQPSPQSSQDPTLANIAQKVESYGKKIDSLESYQEIE